MDSIDSKHVKKYDQLAAEIDDLRSEVHRLNELPDQVKANASKLRTLESQTQSPGKSPAKATKSDLTHLESNLAEVDKAVKYLDKDLSLELKRLKAKLDTRSDTSPDITDVKSAVANLMAFKTKIENELKPMGEV